MANTRMKIARRIAGVIAIVLGVALTGFAETVTNVRGAQRENSKLVDIYYDLNDSDGGTYYVEVEVVGRTSDVNASSFSGDVGEGVVPGQNRRIIWDAGADWPGNKGEVKAVVTAIKGGKPNKVQLWEGGPYWADRNIGADNPWDYGLYFWWGDTVGYKSVGDAWVASDGSSSIFPFTSSDRPTCGKSTDQLRSEGWITSNGVLALSHDAAHVHWGGNWRMPTYQELNDLCHNKCDWTWMTMNGIKGFVVRGRGDYASNSIFLPATGKCGSTSLFYSGSCGFYWSSVPYSYDSYQANILYFNSYVYGMGTSDGSRAAGIPVRPVQGVTK